MDPIKLCECGCGNPAPVARWSDASRGLVKGCPRKFIKGHNRRKVLPTLSSILANTVETTSGCLEWRGGCSKAGYGTIRGTKSGAYVHRLVFEAAKRELTEGEVVRHACDNPKCVNPEHLLAGTQADNIKDAVERGRHAKGEQNGKAKLTEDQVRYILSSAESQRALAARFQVSRSAVALVRQGVNWKHLSRGCQR